MSDNTPQQGLTSELRKLVPGMILTALIAFATSWWNTQTTQNDLRFRIDKLEEKQVAAAAVSAESAKNAQINAERLAVLAERQLHVAEQLREAKAEQERLRIR